MKNQNFQIRTNSHRFGDSFGVYDIEQKKFVKQTEYSHGTFPMETKEARDLTKKLNDNFRNGIWARLYEIIG